MITLITLGKVKDKRIAAIIDEYIKRLSKWTRVEILVLKDEELNKQTVSEQLKLKEAERVLKALEKRSGFIIALDDTGKQFDSYGFAELVKQKSLSGNLVFIIGGTIGLHDNIIKKAGLCLSFGKMTFTRDMSRMLLIEQLFRAYKINAGERYQK